MKIKNIFILANASLILLLLAACAALNPKPVATAFVPTTVQPATSIEYHFVTDKLLIPTTLEQSQAFALNVDGDAQGHTDNMFGTLLSLLTSAAPNLKLQSTLDEAVKTGQVVTLHAVKEDVSQNNSNVSWNIFLGEKSQTPPKFDGSDKFKINSSMPANSPIVGSLTKGHFTGGPGSARIQMFLLNQLVDVNLIGVRLDADVSEKGCANGKIGGGITVEEFQGKLLPAISVGLNQAIKTDQAGAKPILQALDSDQNGTITVQEIENNPLMMIAASPDLDLLDTSGKFNPNQDGIKDSYSVGLGFTCVVAIFTLPGE
jgi:hypothetical protein